MNLGSFGNGRGKDFLVAAATGVAITVVAAAGTFEASAHFLFTRDGASKAATPASIGKAADARVVLDDGRSRIDPRWKESFQRFAESDRLRPPAEGGVVFVGSSSIDFWSDLQARFPMHSVVQRGLAGATMNDCARYADRLIVPYRPRVIVVYAGDNDLAAGIAPERIVADYAELIRRVHRELPAARFVFVSVKPSPSRMALLPLIKRTNALMETYADTAPGLDFVDIFTAMLDRESHPRRELFLADGLHMTPAGYAIWRDAIVDYL